MKNSQKEHIGKVENAIKCKKEHMKTKTIGRKNTEVKALEKPETRWQSIESVIPKIAKTEAIL